MEGANETVFGRYGNWRNVLAEGPFHETVEEYEALVRLDYALLCGYAAHVLSYAGFVLVTPSPSFVVKPRSRSEYVTGTILSVYEGVILPGAQSENECLLPDLVDVPGQDDLADTFAPGFLRFEKKTTSEPIVRRLHVSFRGHHRRDTEFTDYRAVADGAYEIEIAMLRNLPIALLRESEGKEKSIGAALGRMDCFRRMFVPRDFAEVREHGIQEGGLSDEERKEEEHLARGVLSSMLAEGYAPACVLVDPRLILANPSVFDAARNALAQKCG